MNTSLIDTHQIDFPTRVALVHEWFTPGSVGGAEKVVRQIDQFLFSKGCKVELAALVDGESQRPESWLSGRDIQTSFVQKFPFGVNKVQHYLPLLPLAIEQLDFCNCPLVISSNHLVAKGILLAPDQLHVSYIHTPVRYAWDQMNIYLKKSTLRRYGFGPLIRWQLHSLRKWDQLSAARVDCLIANSRFTSRRISRYWRRKAEIVHPPVDVGRFHFDKERDSFYLCLSRLVPNKRVDLVIKAFNELQLPLIVVGDGPEKKSLQKLAGSNVQILGFQASDKVSELMERCRAYVYAGIEDFGIAPVEAMAAGAPVIAFGKGGLLDTVCCASNGFESATGVLFKSQTVDSLVEAVRWFEEKRLWTLIPPEKLNAWASRFSNEAFKKRFEKVLNKALIVHEKTNRAASIDPSLILALEESN
ncbi:glycosyltransferase [Prochlorococcus sp. MIT 1223]|uniref:glycosyltransferase n=1 Tax=Prochlorococcus sp. MIT 1223 TaxID=3096217 RepID=UPI002A7522A2|nr:glycosyltransferase [Prochlorococcus sp. MIT 1223]